MKMKALFTFCLGLLLMSTSAFKTSAPSAGEQEFIMCIVHGEYTQQQGFEIAREFKAKYPVTSVARLDANSKKFFIVYEKEKISRDNVIGFFDAKKMKATCLHRGIHGVDKVPDITAAECK